MKIHSLAELETLQKTIQDHIAASHEKMKKQIYGVSVMDFLMGLRFQKTGVDPVKGTPLNFVEQLNQLFSDLVVIEAARYLFSLFPHQVFELRLGPASGFDIESEDGTIAAECFAVTIAASNSKLDHDSKKIQDKASGQEKYIFFYSQYDTDEKLQKIYAKYPDIHFVRIYGFSRW